MTGVELGTADAVEVAQLSDGGLVQGEVLFRERFAFLCFFMTFPYSDRYFCTSRRNAVLAKPVWGPGPCCGPWSWSSEAVVNSYQFVSGLSNRDSSKGVELPRLQLTGGTHRK
jgi:hypothetical protein